MKLLKDLGTNILILVVIGFVLYLIMPDMMKAILEILGAWGPGVALLVVIIIAFPKGRRRHR